MGTKKGTIKRLGLSKTRVAQMVSGGAASSGGSAAHKITDSAPLGSQPVSATSALHVLSQDKKPQSTDLIDTGQPSRSGPPGKC